MLHNHNCIQDTNTITSHSFFFFGLHFADPRDLAVWHLHMSFTSLAILLVLTSPSPTQDSLSLPHLSFQGGHFHSACHLFFGLKSNKKVMEASSELYLWDHHTPIHDQIVAKPTEALAMHCTCIFVVVISKPCAEAEVQGQVHHKLNSLHHR